MEAAVPSLSSKILTKKNKPKRHKHTNPKLVVIFLLEDSPKNKIIVNESNESGLVQVVIRKGQSAFYKTDIQATSKHTRDRLLHSGYIAQPQ